jgi:hypothetical protein
MNSLSTAIALFNMVATTLEFSFVSRSIDNRYIIPLNLYNMILARSCMRILIDYANLKFLFYIFSVW